MVGHSQGALIAQTIISRMDDHKVDTFISIASPLMGVYGHSITVNL
jgi:alpha-beta hydrolase superfamily lysophospholipase